MHVALCVCNFVSVYPYESICFYRSFSFPHLLFSSTASRGGSGISFFFLKKTRVYIKNIASFEKCQFLTGIAIVYDWILILERQKSGSHLDLESFHSQRYFCMRAGIRLPKNAKPLFSSITSSILLHYAWPTPCLLAIQSPPPQLLCNQPSNLIPFPSSPLSCLLLGGCSDVIKLTLTIPIRPGFVSFKSLNKPRRQTLLSYPPHLAKEKSKLGEEGTLPKVVLLIKGRDRNQTQIPLNPEPTLPSTMPWTMAIDGATIGTSGDRLLIMTNPYTLNSQT